MLHIISRIVIQYHHTLANMRDMLPKEVCHHSSSSILGVCVGESVPMFMCILCKNVATQHHLPPITWPVLDTTCKDLSYVAG